MLTKSKSKLKILKEIHINLWFIQSYVIEASAFVEKLIEGEED